MKQKKIQYLIPILLGASMAIGIFIGFLMRSGMTNYSFFETPRTNTLQEIIQLIADRYVDEKNMDSLAQKAIYPILDELDPHSDYLDPEKLEDTNDDIEGSFCGIGINYFIYKDSVFVTNVMKGSPAEKAGILSGDRILSVNNKRYDFSKLKDSALRVLFKGPCESKIKLKLWRKTQKKEINIDLVRGEIPDKSIAANYMIDVTTGYIKINSFNIHTHAEFMQALLALKNKGMQQLILDLRDNGGGVLSEATEIADEFLDGDKLITYTEGAHRKKKEIRCKRLGQFETGKLVVLSNRETASASEILMGALQDWDRATIIGERSFGKGLVQELFDLNNGGALKLTVARYYTPLGRSIQRSYQNGLEAYYDELNNRTAVETDSTNTPPTSFHTKSGKTLYEKNGISSDIKIKDSITQYEASIIPLLENSVLSYYCNELNENQFSRLDTSVNNSIDFFKNFSIDSRGWERLQQIAKTAGISITTFNEKEKLQITRWVALSLISILWEENKMIEADNHDNPVIKTAVQQIKK